MREGDPHWYPWLQSRPFVEPRTPFSCRTKEGNKRFQFEETPARKLEGPSESRRIPPPPRNVERTRRSRPT